MIISSPEDLRKAKESGRILRLILSRLKEEIKVGAKGSDLDSLAYEIARKNKARCAFKGYGGYPANICLSLNNEIVHGIPYGKVLQQGDIVSVDVGIDFHGMNTDAAFSQFVGDNPSPEIKRLLETVERSLEEAIKLALPGVRLGEVGNKIQSITESEGFFVVKGLTGHGIGYSLHDEPSIPNWGKPGTGEILKEGMMLAIEPMASLGTDKIKLLSDGWTYSTADKSPAAHFEHTLIVQKEQALVLA